MKRAGTALCLAGVFCAVAWQGAALARAESALPTQATQKESTQRGNTAYNDETAIRSAAETSMSLVDLGKVAEQKARRPEVKKFAQSIVEEHSKITEQLKQLGTSEHINLPTSVSRKDADTHRQLAKESENDFDRSYTEAVASELQKEIGEFERGASATNKPQLKDFFERTRPTLEAQLQQARQLERSSR